MIASSQETKAEEPVICETDRLRGEVHNGSVVKETGELKPLYPPLGQ